MSKVNDNRLPSEIRREQEESDRRAEHNRQWAQVLEQERRQAAARSELNGLLGLAAVWPAAQGGAR